MLGFNSQVRIFITCFVKEVILILSFVEENPIGYGITFYRNTYNDNKTMMHPSSDNDVKANGADVGIPSAIPDRHLELIQ